MSELIDITGKRFGNLLVIQKVSNKGVGKRRKPTKWLCVCDCGEERVVESYNLRTGITSGCKKCNVPTQKTKTKTGVNKIDNLIGRRFERLTVLQKSNRKNKKGYGTYWDCKCDCGNTTTVNHYQLIYNKTKSCGCFFRDMVNNGVKNIKIIGFSIAPGRASANVIYYKYKKNAGYRNLPFDLSFDEFHNITQQPCYYCGELLSSEYRQGHSNGSFKYNGIDRKDNNDGYTKENAVACCGFCNKMKLAHTEKEFINKVKEIYNHTVLKDAYNPSEQIRMCGML